MKLYLQERRSFVYDDLQILCGNNYEAWAFWIKSF